MNKEIQLPYKIILRNLLKKSHLGKVKTKDMRVTLFTCHRMGKENINNLYEEMKSLGYIKYNGSINSGFTILIGSKDLS